MGNNNFLASSTLRYVKITDHDHDTRIYEGVVWTEAADSITNYCCITTVYVRICCQHCTASSCRAAAKTHQPVFPASPLFSPLLLRGAYSIIIIVLFDSCCLLSLYYYIDYIAAILVFYLH